MAAGMLSKPGTEFGPCATDCQHTDCAQSREMADRLCKVCYKPIGYDRRFYDVGRYMPDGRRLVELAHASCVELEKGGEK